MNTESPLARARRMLAQVATALEAQLDERGTCQIYLARQAAEVAVLLRLDAESDRLRAVWLQVQPAWIGAGALTNVEPSPHRRHAPSILSIEALESRYPRCPPDHAAQILGRVGWPKAATDVQSTDDMELLALARIIQRDFVAAGRLIERLRVAERNDGDLVSPSARHQNVSEVLALELYRAGEIARADALVDTLEIDPSTSWFLVQAALVLHDRLPWPYYPFPDY